MPLPRAERANNNMDVWVQTRQRLRWLRGLMGRLHGLDAGALWSAVALLVLRQLLLLLAMFLPFQVMFMLATRQVSRYLTWVPASVPFESLVVALVLAVLALYGLQLLCARWATARLAVAASVLLAHAKKLAMFKDDRQHARDVVQRLAAWCMACLLWLVYAALGLWVDAPVFAAVLALVAAQCVLAQGLLRHPSARVGRALKWIQAHRARAFSAWGNGLFLFGFLVLFVQFLRAGGDMLTAILALLLLRQLTVWLSQWALGVVTLSALRHRVDALFDPQQHYAPPAAASLNTFVAWLAPGTREDWMRAALQQVTGLPISGTLTAAWNDTGLLGLAAFDVELAGDGAARHNYFVRCFAPTLRQQAEHEASLFESQTPPPMAPRYLGRTQVDESMVLVFEGLPRQRPAQADLAALRKQCHQGCAGLALDGQLVSAYTRSHATLPHRLDALLLTRLRVAAADDTQREGVERFACALDDMRQRLVSLPCVLENPDVSPAFIRVGEDGPKLWQWQRWRADLVHPHVPWAAPPERAWVTTLAALERATRNGRPAEAVGKLPEVLALWAQVLGSGAGSAGCPESQTAKNTT